MLKKSLLGVSIFFQVFLVGMLSIYIYSVREKEEIVEDIFSEKIEVATTEVVKEPRSSKY